MESIQHPLVKKTEKLKNNQFKGKNGGARPGAGRPKHSKNPATITREEALRQFRDKVAKAADQLFITQFNLARGEQFLFHKKTTGKGDKRKTETVIVTDVETIKDYITGNIDNDSENYYFISTKPANNQALDSLLNRTFGTAQQSIDLTSDQKALPAPIYGGLSVRRDGPTD
jgi:hypothetical protein